MGLRTASMHTHMSEGAEAALRPRMSLSFGARSCRVLTWKSSGAKRSVGISTWCSMARLQGTTPQFQEGSHV